MFRENELVVLFGFFVGIFASFYHQLPAYYIAERIPFINTLLNTDDINEKESIPYLIRIKFNALFVYVIRQIADYYIIYIKTERHND